MMLTDAENDVVFLGLADNVSEMEPGLNALPHFNIVGLSNYVGVLFLPAALSQKVAILAVNLNKKEKIEISAFHDNVFVMKLDLDFLPDAKLSENKSESLIIANNEENNSIIGSQKIHSQKFTFFPSSWTVVALRLAIFEDLFLDKVGKYEIFITKGGDKMKKIGELVIVELDVTPMSPEVRSALLADPTVAKNIQAKFSCRICADAIEVYYDLIPTLRKKEDNVFNVDTLPDIFHCKCGKLEIRLEKVKKNFHGLLLNQPFVGGEISVERAYTSASLNIINRNFEKIVSRDQPEEVIQKFIEKNPILFSQFSPNIIKYKAPILNFYKTDFVILNAVGELIFIEIERSSTPLVKGDGDVHSKTSHAIEQVFRWINEFSDHKAAILHDWNTIPANVIRVRGIVICGRDSNHNPENVKKLKTRTTSVTLLSYDDIISSMNQLARKIRVI